MITQAEFMGGGLASVLTGNVTLKRGSKRLQAFYPYGAARNVTLPDARKLRTGGPHFFIVNVGPEDAAVKDAAGGAVITLGTNETAIILLLDNSTSTGSWWYNVGTVQGYASVLEDAYDDTDGLSGPFTGQMIAPAISAASSILSFSGDGHVAVHHWAECGRIGGAFFFPGRDFILETAITALDNSNCGARGSIGFDDRDAANGSGEWYIKAGCAVMGCYLFTGGTMHISGKTDVGFPNDVVAYTPSVLQPVRLRIEYDHGTTTVTFKYRGDAEGGWTTLAAHNVGADYWTDKMDAFVIIDNPTANGTGNFSVDFDSFSLRIS